MSNSPYGKRGGTSVNAGKKATTYTVVFPDGTTTTKKSYSVHTPTALAGVFQHEGKWHVSGITDAPRDWPGQQFIEVKVTT